MKVRKTIKKLVALGTGAVMVGATVLSAMAAADLGNYPKPFVKDGKFDGLIVVGEAAASMDVVGAIDIATSLQYAVKQTQSINVGVSAGSVSISGDNAKFGDTSDMLEIDEMLGTVKETVTSSDMQLLKSGVISTNAGTTDYNQFLKFSIDGAETGAVQFLKNADTDEVGDFLYYEDEDLAFQYQLEFEEGLKSDYLEEDGKQDLTDYEDESLVLLGKSYSIVQSEIDDGDGETTITLELLGGDVTDTLYEGETKKYTIAGNDYEVEALIVSDTLNTVKLKVNGEVTKQLGDGDTTRLSDGTEVGLRDIMPNDAKEEGGGDLVEFYIGANKLVFEDDFADEDFSAIDVNDKTLNNAEVSIVGTCDAGTCTINSIKVNYYASTDYGDVYIKPGQGLREVVTEPEGLLSPDWDLVYEGMSDTGFVDVKFVPQGDKAYKLQFTSQDNMKYNVPLVTTDNEEAFQWGDDSKRLWFVEDISIPKRDYFVLTSDTADDILAGADGAYTHVLRFDSVDDNNHILTFSDLASGQVQAVYDEVNFDGNLIVGGTTYAFEVDEGNEELLIDMDGTGDWEGERTVIVTKGGLVVDLDPAEDLGNDLSAATEVNITLTTAAKHFDEAAVADEIQVTISDVADGEEVDIDVTDGLDLLSVEGQDLERGMTLYGAVYELTNTDSAEDTSALSIMHPLDQREALVYVVAGDVTSTRTGAAAGTVETVKLEKINVGAAKLDSEIGNVWAQNLILVGGPCANQAAAQVMGVSAYNCADGFVEGKAMIKLYESNGKVAMLVAGYSAMDTRRAARVISDYEKYKTQLVGTEREIVGTTLTDITIQ